MPSNNACLISLNVSISWVSITVYPIWKALMPSTPLSVEETINVTCLDPTAKIHYTTDGSTPTLQSPVYEGPIKVTETTDFTFCTFRPNGKKGDITQDTFHQK